MRAESSRRGAWARVLAAIVIALAGALLSNPAFEPVAERFAGEGRQVSHRFELAGPESLFLDYELVLRSRTGARPRVVVHLNGTLAAELPVQALFAQAFGKVRLPATATRPGTNEVIVSVDGEDPSDIELRARLHNYVGIAPDVPRAVVVSDEAVAIWWAGGSWRSQAGLLVVMAGFAAAVVWLLPRLGVAPAGALGMCAPACLLVPVLLWSLATDRHVWVYPETLLLLVGVPWALVLAAQGLVRRRMLVLKIAAAVLITLGMLEGALRVTNAVSPSFIFYTDSFGRYRGRPGAPFRDTVLNSGGFNDVERTIARPPHIATRIVALGDSFAFGVVPHADNYLTLVERGLTADAPTEVINMGVSATDPADYRSVLVDEGLAYQPDLVLVGVYLGNDLDARRPRWYEHSYVTTLVNFLWNVGRARQTVVLDEGADRVYDDDAPSLDERAFLRIQMERASLYTGADATLAADVDRAVRPLADICDLARGIGADCLVVLIPDETQVDAALQAEVARAWDRPLASIDFAGPTRVLSTALASAGVPTLDLLPAFQAEAASTRLYKPRDTHWNRAGNRLAASEIVKALREWRTRRSVQTDAR